MATATRYSSRDQTICVIEHGIKRSQGTG